MISSRGSLRAAWCFEDVFLKALTRRNATREQRFDDILMFQGVIV